MTKSIAFLLTALWLVGCGAKPRALSPGANLGPSQATQRQWLSGEWRGPCLPGAGETFLQTDYRFTGDTQKLDLTVSTFGNRECAAPAALSYFVSGTYVVLPSATSAPLSLHGEIKEASLVIRSTDYLAAANRTPGLYGFSEWILDTVTPLMDKLPPEYLTDAAKDIFSSLRDCRVEENRLLVLHGTPVQTESYQRIVVTARVASR